MNYKNCNESKYYRFFKNNLFFSRPDLVFFFSAFFFIFGIFLKSLDLGFFTIHISILSFLSFLFLKLTKFKKYYLLSFLSFFILFGAFYYTLDDLNFKSNLPVFNKKISSYGVISSNPINKDNSLNFYLDIESGSKILVRTSKYPSYDYGDKLFFSGVIKKPNTKSYENYLAKEGVSGVLYYPDINFINSGNGSNFKSFLYSTRNNVHKSFKKILPPLQAAFLNGVTLGGYEGFTEDFKEDMSLSGTTHLVALSGYNITIIILAFSSLFLGFFSKKVTYFLTIIFIICFVLMTGAEASIVRAAIMGIIVLVANYSGRVYDLKNGLILTALIMILINPKVLVFDVGFQLSFLAVLGIIYLKKSLERILKFKNTPGFLSWRDNLLTTASAQLAVVPILMFNFGTFSPISLITNMVILEFIPITMFFGFLIAGLSFISYNFSLVLGWFVGVLLFFETGFIKLFSKISFPLVLNFGLLGIIIYYFLLIFLIYKFNKKCLV
jgi:competence protein ComEC